MLKNCFNPSIKTFYSLDDSISLTHDWKSTIETTPSYQLVLLLTSTIFFSQTSPFIQITIFFLGKISTFDVWANIDNIQVSNGVTVEK